MFDVFLILSIAISKIVSMTIITMKVIVQIKSISNKKRIEIFKARDIINYMI